MENWNVQEDSLTRYRMSRRLRLERRNTPYKVITEENGCIRIIRPDTEEAIALDICSIKNAEMA